MTRAHRDDSFAASSGRQWQRTSIACSRFSRLESVSESWKGMFRLSCCRGRRHYSESNKKLCEIGIYIFYDVLRRRSRPSIAALPNAFNWPPRNAINGLRQPFRRISASYVTTHSFPSSSTTIVSVVVITSLSPKSTTLPLCSSNSLIVNLNGCEALGSVGRENSRSEVFFART